MEEMSIKGNVCTETRPSKLELDHGLGFWPSPLYAILDSVKVGGQLETSKIPFFLRLTVLMKSKEACSLGRKVMTKT